MLDPENNGTVSPESLWRMTGGSQIGNCMKSVRTSNHQNGRPNLEIMIASVTKNYMGSRKCPFRRACAVEWFGQISRLGSSVASIWYMATDFGRRFVTWEHYTTWAQRRDFRGRKGILLILLAFHEFLSDLLHIYRVKRWECAVWLGTKKFRFFTHKRNIFAKMSIFDFSKKAIFGGVMSKNRFLGKWWYRYGLYYGFGSETLYTTFPNIVSWKSAILADLSKKWNLSYFGKKWSFSIQKIVLGTSKVVR